MSKWIAEFELEDGDTMPEHMDLNYMGAKIDFHCRHMWIPVSEKLPEDGTWNMFTDGKQISVERFKLDAVNHFFPEGRWFSFDEAVAWMPLPQPYRGESEESE